MRRSRFGRGLGAVILVAGILAAPNQSFAKGRPGGGGGGGGSGSPNTFSGEATVFSLDALNVINLDLTHVGPLPAGGGAAEGSALGASVDGILSLDALGADTIAQGNDAKSDASVADVDVTVPGLSVSASLISSQAKAHCDGNTASASGSSDLASLTVNGQKIAISGGPNQIVVQQDLLNLVETTIAINEQSISQGGNSAAATVTALHVTVVGADNVMIAELVVSQAHADITCNGAPGGSQGDFVTGGGFITGTPSGAKGTFAIAGGTKKVAGRLFGHLVFHDHGNEMKVKGTGVTSYTVLDAVTRRIQGTCQINGQGNFTYDAIVADNGEPGRNDLLDLKLSNGYHAAGLLGGGNIQLHVKP